MASEMNNNNLEFWQTATKSNLHKNIIYKNNILSNQGKNTQQNLQRNTHPSQDKFICTYIDFHESYSQISYLQKKSYKKKQNCKLDAVNCKQGVQEKCKCQTIRAKKLARTFL